jgi:hypothetical protein
MCIDPVSISIISIKVIAGKIAAAHAAHTVAAKVAFAEHHPLSTVLQETAQHGLNSFMKNPAIHPAVKAALVQVLQHESAGATGLVAGPAGTGSALHTAAQFAKSAALAPAAQLFRETEAYQQLTDFLSDRRGEWNEFVASIRNASA